MGWDQAMSQLEAAAAEDRELSAHDAALWGRIVEAVSPLVPDAEVVEGERSCTFDDGVAMQLHLFPGEISINSPYSFSGEAAKEVVSQLRAVAGAIEQATGLVAYDPQADAGFLDSGCEQAAATFDRMSGFLADETEPEPAAQPRPSRWAFWKR